MSIMMSFVGQKVRKKLKIRKIRGQTMAAVRRKMTPKIFSWINKRKIRRSGENTVFPHYNG